MYAYMKLMHGNGDFTTQNQYQKNGNRLQHFKVGYFSVLIEIHVS